MATYKVDTLDMGRGAFQALCDSKGVEVVRSGTTFAVGAFFPVLSLSHMIDRGFYTQSLIENGNLEAIFSQYQSNMKRRQGGSKVKLILPSVEASQIVSIDRAVGLGGGSHEVGHIICDMAGNDLSPQTAQKIIPVYKEFAEKKYNLFKVLGRWSNVCADIRLEKMMSKLYPESQIRFHSIQEWIWNDLESKARLSGQMAQNPTNCIALMIRDLGKDHKSKSQQRVFNEYATLYPNLWQCALSVKHLYEQLQVDIKEYTTFKKKADMEKEIEKTVHLPLTIAMQILMALEMPKDKKQPPQDQNPQPKDQDQPNDPNEDQDQDNQDDQDDCNGGQGGDGDDDSEAQDQDSQDQDDQDSDSDDQDSDDQDSDNQDSQDQDSQDQNSQDSKDQDQDSQDSDYQDNQDQDSKDQDIQDSDCEAQDNQDQDSDCEAQDSQDQDQNSQDQDSDCEAQDSDSQDNQDQDSQDQDHLNNNPALNNSSRSSFDENTELNLEEQIDPNDISKAFQKQFDRLAKNLQHKPYISNGLKILDIQE